MRISTKKAVSYGNKAIKAERRAPVLQTAKAVLAIVLAWLASLLLFPETSPVLAAVTAFIVIQPSINQTLTRGLENTVGAVLGVIIALSVGTFLPYNAYGFSVVISGLLAVLIGWVLRLGEHTVAQLTVSAMFVIVLVPENGAYWYARILESLLGAIVGFVINLILVPPIQLAEAYRKMIALTGRTSSAMLELADALMDPQPHKDTERLQETVDFLKQLLAETRQALENARESMLLNHRAKKIQKKFMRDLELFERLERVVDHLIDMIQVYLDNFAPELSQDSTVKDIAEQLERASHDLQLFKRKWLSAKGKMPADRVFATKEIKASMPPTSAVPVLTAPLRVPRPDPTHWIMIGSMVADLKRIHKLITRER